MALQAEGRTAPPRGFKDVAVVCHGPYDSMAHPGGLMTHAEVGGLGVLPFIVVRLVPIEQRFIGVKRAVRTLLAMRFTKVVLELLDSQRCHQLPHLNLVLAGYRFRLQHGLEAVGTLDAVIIQLVTDENA